MIDHRVLEELASEDEISDSEPQMLKCLQPNGPLLSGIFFM